MAVTGRFVLLVLFGVIPVILGSVALDLGWLALLTWLLVCILLGTVDLALAASPRTVEIERGTGARVRLGESSVSTLTISNRGARSIAGVVRDAWQPTAGAHSTRSPIRIPAGERRRIETVLTPFRRGERRVEEVTIRSMGPLGLWARQATLAAPGAVRVLPPFHSRKHLPSRLARLRELEGRTSVMVRGQGTEFDSLREYVRGDDVRSIDWRATARRGSSHGPGSQVVVRTWRPERDRRVVVVVDSGRTSAARVGDETRLDSAIESTLLLGVLASRAGDRVDLLAYDRRPRARVQGVTGAELLARLVDALAPVEPELLETDWAAIPGQVRAISSQRSLVVLMTTIESAAGMRPLLSVLPQLTRRHTVIVASVVDPDVQANALRRSGRTEVYRAASAERALLDAARVSAALTRLGAEVVTASPADLPVALTDRYLAMKAAGRL